MADTVPPSMVEEVKSTFAVSPLEVTDVAKTKAPVASVSGTLGVSLLSSSSEQAVIAAIIRAAIRALP
jgi:hypothetical protein